MRSSSLLRLHRLSLSLASVAVPALFQKDQRPPLTAVDIEAITQLVMLEDTRQFDEAALAKLLTSAHPEVRRRAVVAVGRIVNPAGKALLVSARKDQDVGDRRDGGVRHGSGEGCRRGPVAVRVADGHEHAASGRTRSGPGARQDPDPRGAHRPGAVSDERVLTAGCRPGRRRGASRDRPVHDARRPGADSPLDHGCRRRDAVASGVGALSASRSSRRTSTPGARC